jgi:hypothetical protein
MDKVEKRSLYKGTLIGAVATVLAGVFVWLITEKFSNEAKIASQERMILFAQEITRFEVTSELKIKEIENSLKAAEESFKAVKASKDNADKLVQDIEALEAVKKIGEKMEELKEVAKSAATDAALEHFQWKEIEKKESKIFNIDCLHRVRFTKNSSDKVNDYLTPITWFYPDFIRPNELGFLQFNDHFYVHKNNITETGENSGAGFKKAPIIVQELCWK